MFYRHQHFRCGIQLIEIVMLWVYKNIFKAGHVLAVFLASYFNFNNTLICKGILMSVVNYRNAHMVHIFL